jgi:hypothetical protein
VGEGHEWFEWEDRPGSPPAANATDSDDELLIRVCLRGVRQREEPLESPYGQKGLARRLKQSGTAPDAFG